MRSAAHTWRRGGDPRAAKRDRDGVIDDEEPEEEPNKAKTSGATANREWRHTSTHF